MGRDEIVMLVLAAVWLSMAGMQLATARDVESPWVLLAFESLIIAALLGLFAWAI